MPEYRVEITIHETGEVIVEAESVKDAMRGIREGWLSWDHFDQTEHPKIGVRRAWREGD